jgi:Na+/H+ antiporter NhaD/arsenite permease-like protein
LREAVQLALVALSLLLGSQAVRSANRFNYGAIIEVAALFIGIFICMQPAIEILRVKGPNIGLTQPWHFFWATGSLSSVLDNAPTYVVFFETAAADFPDQNFARLVNTDSHAAGLLIGISLGAVFMGAMTYIGNGPNFMVKAIAEQSGVKMPSFFGYVILYSIPVLLPLFILVTFIFLV